MLFFVTTHYLKMASQEIFYLFYECSPLLGFIMSKKQERLRSELLSEDKITNIRFFDIIKPRRIEHLQSEEPFSSDPYFRIEIVPANIQNCLNLLETNHF